MATQGGYLISKLHQLSGRHFQQILTARGVEAFRGAQGLVLYVLWQNDALPMSELSRQTTLAATTLTSVVDRMERDGLVCRTAHPGDRRKTLISLTPMAHELQAEFAEVTMLMEERFYRGFTDAEVLTFEMQLRRILRNLEEA